MLGQKFNAFINLRTKIYTGVTFAFGFRSELKKVFIDNYMKASIFHLLLEPERNIPSLSLTEGRQTYLVTPYYNNEL